MTPTLPEALARVERLRIGWTITREDKADIDCVLAEAHRAQRLREALEQTRPYVEAAARGSHMMDGFDIGDDGLPCRKEPWVETQEDRILARLTAVLGDTR